MAHGCSSKLMAATPPAFAPLHRLAENSPCLKSKHILLAFVRQSDVKTSEPSLPQKLVLYSTRVSAQRDRIPRIVALGGAICEPSESAHS
jgi:hypothetical protein